jgi:PAS domain S-box-containing protein
MSTKTLSEPQLSGTSAFSTVLNVVGAPRVPFRLVLTVALLTFTISFVVHKEVSQHSIDHLADTQLTTAQSVEEGVEVINRDLKSITAYVANVGEIDPQLFGAFVMDLKEQGLCAESLVGIGVVPLADLGVTNFSHGKLTDVERKEIIESPEFIETIELAILAGQSAVTRSFEGVIDREWVRLVAFVSPVKDTSGAQHIVFAIHNSESLVDQLIPADPSTHGVGAYSVRISDFRDDSYIGSAVFSQIENDQLLSSSGRAASVLNTMWGVQVTAPKNYAQLRSDKAAVIAVLLGGLVVGWLAITSVQAVRRKQRFLRNRADLAESLYDEEVGRSSRLIANSQVVLEAATESILLVDQDRNIVWINEAFKNLFDLNDEDWAGRNSSELKNSVADEGSVPDGYHSEIDSIYLDHGYTEQSRIVKITKRDDVVFASRSTVPVEEEDGTYIGRLWIYHDVTEVQELAEARSQLVSVVSHELRTPLTTVRGHIELLEDGILGEMPSKQSKSVMAASRALNRLGVLVDDLLDLSRIDSEALKIDYEIVCADQLIKEIVGEFRLRFEHSNLALRSDIDALGTIWCDPYRYSQILANLLSNAERYTPEGGAVTVTARIVDSDLVVSVSDTGIGIPPNYVEKIFDPFTTASVVSYKKDGSTGLGLAIVRGLTELHGGHVNVVSTLGVGSTFRVDIPVVPPAESVNSTKVGIGSRNL